jgi:hypothetical protein
MLMAVVMVMHLLGKQQNSEQADSHKDYLFKPTHILSSSEY